MFKKHRSPVQGQKSKLVAFVAYALAGLLASGSAYAVDDAEFKTVKDTVNKHEAYLNVIKPELGNYLKLFKDVEKDYPAYKARFDAAEERLNDLNEKIFGENENSLYEHMFGKDGFDERIAANETEINSTKEALAYLLPGVAAQKDAIDGNAKNIADIKKQVDTNTKDIADINDYLVKQYDSIFGDAPDALENMVLDNDEKLTNHEARIAANEEGISKTANALADLLPAIAAQKDVIDEHEDKITKTGLVLDGLANVVEKNQTQVDANKKAIADNKKAIDDNFAETKKNVNRLAEETLKGITALNNTKADKTAVEENKALIQATAEAVDETGKLLAALAPDVAETKEALNYKADQGYVDGMVKEIAERYDPVLEELHKNQLTKEEKTEVKEAAARAKVLSRQVDNNRREVVQLATAVNTDLTAVKNALNTKANQEDLQKVDARVTKVESVVEAQGTAIQSLNNRISGFGSQISDLHNKMEKLEDNVESGLAIQSAHAALFQPYRVGHVNVTAGLGGYKSKTALAVGVGYRFNERVAAKAGVAADTKGKRASYNLGVNFEF